MAKSLIRVWLRGNNFRLISNKHKGGGRGYFLESPLGRERERVRTTNLMPVPHVWTVCHLNEDFSLTSYLIVKMTFQFYILYLFLIP